MKTERISIEIYEVVRINCTLFKNKTWNKKCVFFALNQYALMRIACCKIVAHSVVFPRFRIVVFYFGVVLHFYIQYYEYTCCSCLSHMLASINTWNGAMHGMNCMHANRPGKHTYTKKQLKKSKTEYLHTIKDYSMLRCVPLILSTAPKFYHSFIRATLSFCLWLSGTMLLTVTSSTNTNRTVWNGILKYEILKRVKAITQCLHVNRSNERE